VDGQDVCQELLEVVPGVGAAAGAGAKELRRTELLSCRRLRVPALELTDTTHSVHVLAEEMSKLGYKVSYGFLNDEARAPPHRPHPRRGSIARSPSLSLDTPLGWILTGGQLGGGHRE
jgi:hypothetical protein